MRTVSLASGLSLRVVEAGDENAAPVLLLHGWGASVYMWREWFAPLAAAGRKVIAVDLPGHGLSGKPDDAARYRLSGMLAVVREVMDLAGLRDTDIIAQSMGGTIAVELARLAPERVKRLVLVNPACFGRVRIQRLARIASPPVVDRVLPRLVPRWLIARTHRMVYGDPSRVTPRDEDEYWAPTQFPEFARAMRQLVHEFSWSRLSTREMAKQLRAIDDRMLVVLGTKDSLVRDAAPYVAALRGEGCRFRVEMIAGGGHAVNEERPEEVVPLALEFLRSSGDV
ncbi:MAG: alpha/beta hydrolase [Gemmatimonadota bacterium]|nr:alpha/beta hydrolase [Gemmatimonadota bacterium]